MNRVNIEISYCHCISCCLARSVTHEGWYKFVSLKIAEMFGDACEVVLTILDVHLHDHQFKASWNFTSWTICRCRWLLTESWRPFPKVVIYSTCWEHLKAKVAVTNTKKSQCQRQVHEQYWGQTNQNLILPSAKSWNEDFLCISAQKLATSQARGGKTTLKKHMFLKKEA